MALAIASTSSPMPRSIELSRDVARGQRLVGEDLADAAGELREVGAAHPPPERAVVAADRGDLHQRPQQQGVGHRDEVHGAAHQRHPHGLTLDQHAPEHVRVEALQA